MIVKVVFTFLDLNSIIHIAMPIQLEIQKHISQANEQNDYDLHILITNFECKGYCIQLQIGYSNRQS
jgi:hypothetical protein